MPNERRADLADARGGRIDEPLQDRIGDRGLVEVTHTSLSTPQRASSTSSAPVPILAPVSETSGASLPSPLSATVPAEPSTVTVWPVAICSVAPATPTTAGMPYS